MAILTRTLQQMRQTLAESLNDLFTGTADSGSTVNFMLDTILNTYPDDHFNGYELTALFGTPQSRIVTDFTKSGGSVAFSPNMTTGIGTNSYELHQKFTKLEYDDALNEAIRSVASVAVVDKVDDTLVFRKDLQSYNIPSGFVYLHDVQYDSRRSVTLARYFLSDNVDQDASLGTTSISRRSQSFQLADVEFVRAVALLLRIPSSYSTTRTMTVKIEGDDGDGLPDGSALGTANTVSSSVLDDVYRWVLFTFPQRVRLAKDTRYHIVWSDDITTSDVRASWGIDADAGYATEYACKYDGSWAKVTTQDHCFAVFIDEPSWESISPKLWDVVRTSTRQLYINKSLDDATPLRLLGYQAPGTMSAETDNCPINPDFVKAKAAARLCASMIRRSDNDSEAWSMKAKFWDDQAEDIRANTKTRLNPSSKVIEVQ